MVFCFFRHILNLEFTSYLFCKSLLLMFTFRRNPSLRSMISNLTFFSKSVSTEKLPINSCPEQRLVVRQVRLRSSLDNSGPVARGKYLSQNLKPFPWPIKTLPHKISLNHVQKGYNLRLYFKFKASFIFWQIGNRTFLIIYNLIWSFHQKSNKNPEFSNSHSKPFPKFDDFQNLSLDARQGNKDKYLLLLIQIRLWRMFGTSLVLEHWGKVLPST